MTGKITLDKRTISIITIVISVIGLFGGGHVYTNGFSNSFGGDSSNNGPSGKGILIDAAINQHKAEYRIWGMK